MQHFIFFCLMVSTAPLTAQNQTLSNRHFWHTLESPAKPEQIWAVWTDVANWKNWDTGLKDARMEGSFSLNATGVIISLEGRKSKFTVVAFEPGKSYTFRTKLPLGALYVRRSLSEQNSTTQFTHEVWFKGLTAGIFARQFGPKFRSMLPEVMQKIKMIAEK